MKKTNTFKPTFRSSKRDPKPLFSPAILNISQWMLKYGIFFGLIPILVYLYSVGIFPSGMSFTDGIAMIFACALMSFYLALIVYICSVIGWPLVIFSKVLWGWQERVAKKIQKKCYKLAFYSSIIVIVFIVLFQFDARTQDDFIKPTLIFITGSMILYANFERFFRVIEQKNGTIGIDFIFFLVLGTSLVVGSSTKYFILNPINNMINNMGVSSGNVNVLIATDSDFADLYETNDLYIGCKKNNGYLLSNVDLVWHGIGNVSYIRINNAASFGDNIKLTRGLISIPSSQIKLIDYDAQVGEYCKEFKGALFEKGTKDPSANFQQIRSFAYALSMQFKEKNVSKAVIEWQADPLEVRNKDNNYEISKKRAVVVEDTLKSYFCRDIKAPACRFPTETESIGMGASDDFANCKDWPNPKTKNECLAKNRGGKITVYVKNP